MNEILIQAIRKIAPFLSKRQEFKIFLKRVPFSQKLLEQWYHPLLWDVYLISYPKCGRTWLRLMLGRILALHFKLEGVTFHDLLELKELAAKRFGVPRINVTHDGLPQFKRPEELDTDKSKYRRNRVIFLVRDPRDVIVSNFFQATKRDKYFEGDISSFIRHERYGIETIIRFMNIWYENRHIPSGFLLVRYEDLQAEPHQQLWRIVHFLGLDSVADDVIRDAIEFARFENMQRMEQSGLLNSFRLRPGDPKDTESFKVRRGKVGGYRDYLSEEDIKYLNTKIKKELAEYFGYHP